LPKIKLSTTMPELTAHISTHPTLQDGHTARIYALQQSARYVVSGSADGSVRIWPKTDTHPALPPLHGDPQAAIVTVEVSEELDIVVGGDSRGNITVWRLSDGTHLQTQSAHDDTVLALALDKQLLSLPHEISAQKFGT
jgi:F-box and WD-40 domain protein 1/11